MGSYIYKRGDDLMSEVSGFLRSALSNKAASISSPYGVSSFTRAGARTHLRADQLDFRAELFKALDMACQVKSAKVAAGVYSIVSDPAQWSALIGGGDKYPDARKHKGALRGDGRLYRTASKYSSKGKRMPTISSEVKYKSGWYFTDANGIQLSPADLSKYTRGRKFVVKNTKKRAGQYPIAKYLEFGGARHPADRGRYVLQRTLNYVLARMKYGFEIKGKYALGFSGASQGPTKTGYESGSMMR